MSEDERVPIRVVAHLADPIVYMGDGMHLDGILAAAAFRQCRLAARHDDAAGALACALRWAMPSATAR